MMYRKSKNGCNEWIVDWWFNHTNEIHTITGSTTSDFLLMFITKIQTYQVQQRFSMELGCTLDGSGSAGNTTKTTSGDRQTKSIV